MLHPSIRDMTPYLISTLAIIAHWLIVLVLFARVIMLRPPVGVSMAWMAVIAVAPFLGATVYLLLGERRLGRARAALIAGSVPVVSQWQDLLRAHRDSVDAQVDPVAEPVRQHADRVLGFPALTGNTIQLLVTTDAVFDSLVADLDAAERRIHMCFYIWHDGGRAGDVIDAIVRAAERGVQCRALADRFGSNDFFETDGADRLRAAGVELVAALPSGPIRTFFVRSDLRYHRKIAVIDERIAYTGSLNMVDPKFFKRDSGIGEWIDALARVTGPAAAALDGVFAMDWAVETGGTCELPQVGASAASSTPGAAVQVVPSGPDRHPKAIHQLLLTAIYSARSELVMTTPYFVPDEAILTALLSAALRGVAVTLIVPARIDSLLVRHASAAHFDDLMTAGVRIALFDGGLLHTKSMVVDGSMGIFGSVNLDMRSLWLNFEISLFVYDAAFTRKLKELQHGYLQQSHHLDLATWRQRPTSRRFVENAFRLLGPLL